MPQPSTGVFKLSLQPEFDPDFDPDFDLDANPDFDQQQSLLNGLLHVA